MKPLLFLLSSLLLAACSSTNQIAEDLTLPELVSRTALPEFPRSVAASQLKIDLEILVTEEGSVRYVNLLTPTGHPDWDSATVDAIRHWVYRPALYKGSPVRLWLHQSAIVRFSTPHLISLAEIVCESKEQADSVYSLLKQGCKFCDAAKKYSVSTSKENDGVLGEVNIHTYPENIQQALENIEDGNFTEPLQYGSRYTIFFRMKVPDIKASLD